MQPASINEPTYLTEAFWLRQQQWRAGSQKLAKPECWISTKNICFMMEKQHTTFKLSIRFALDRRLSKQAEKVRGRAVKLGRFCPFNRGMNVEVAHFDSVVEESVVASVVLTELTCIMVPGRISGAYRWAKPLKAMDTAEERRGELTSRSNGSNNDSSLDNKCLALMWTSVSNRWVGWGPFKSCQNENISNVNVQD